jgi:MFS family permease
VIADLWGPDQRGDALALFSCMPTAGPALAPIISGFMYVTNTDYRWIFWVLMIFAGACFVAMVFLLPETYVPFLLQQEAKKLRRETGDQRWVSALERSKANDKPKELFKKTVAKPFIMLFQEPMLAVLTLYVS